MRFSLARGVMVAQEFLALLVMVRIRAGQPIRCRKPFDDVIEGLSLLYLSNKMCPTKTGPTKQIAISAALPAARGRAKKNHSLRQRIRSVSHAEPYQPKCQQGEWNHQQIEEHAPAHNGADLVFTAGKRDGQGR